jgi:uncharacterized protein YqjF (DUF2071 family)
MRQWWGKLLFMHWPVPVSALRPLVPPQLSIDTFEGQAWVGVVPFTMWGVRPSFTPPMPGLNAFHEINVRTYVHHRGVPGVWFHSLDIDSAVATWGARRFFYLPYHQAEMSLRQQANSIDYASTRTQKDSPPASFRGSWTIGESLPTSEPDSLEFFLTERYCLYTVDDEQLYRCRIHHEPWLLRAAEVGVFESSMLESLGVSTPPLAPLLHYAEELKVDIWPLLRVEQDTSDHVFEPAGASESLG